MPLAKLARTTLGALVVTEVHTRDLVHELIENDVTDINNFSWISQLRYGISVFLKQLCNT
jgi:dynein heavy chain